MEEADREDTGNMEEERIFTVGEANNLLPQLEAILIGIKRERRLLSRVESEVKRAADCAEQGGGTSCGPRYIQAIEHIVGGIEEIHERGVLVKDLEKGLCDFPHMLDGRIVYLCWRLGESEVEWWHETHSGYTARQPLPPS